MVVLFVFSALLVVMAGLISIVKPLTFLKIRTRLMGLAVLIGGLVLLVIAGSMIPSSAPTVPASGGAIPSAPTAPASKVTTPSPRTVQPPAETKPDLEVLDVAFEHDEYVRYATGRIRNNSSRRYGYVQVEINLYDESGAQVGSTLANVNNLEPGAIWKFKAVIMEDSARRFVIKDVTGF